MKKVLLINPPYLKNYSRGSRSPAVAKSGTLYYPVLLSYSASIIEKNGYKIKLIDAVADNLNFQDIKNIVYDFKPAFIICDTSIPSGKNDTEFLNRIKIEFPNIFCILVGTYPTAYSDEIENKNYKFDCFIQQEYDYAVLKIIKLKNKVNLKNVFINKNKKFVKGIHDSKKIDLNEFPFVSQVYKKHFNINNYFYSATQYPVITILSSRGCPYKCFFCFMPQKYYFSGYRRRNVENLISEFEYIKNRLPDVKEVFIEDDSFNIDLDYVKQFCKQKIKINNKLNWSINFNPNNFDEDTIKLLKQSNCRLLVIGYETGNNEILKNINKKVDIKTYFELDKLVRKYKFKVHGCFIFGLPKETKQSIINTINLACKLKLDTAQFFPLMLNKGTRLYDLYNKNNWLINQDSDYNTEQGLHYTNVSLPGISEKEIMNYCSIARKKFYLREPYILYKLKQSIFSFWEFKRNLKSFLRFYKYLFK